MTLGKGPFGQPRLEISLGKFKYIKFGEFSISFNIC
jgi:hypothetical protein